MLDAPFCSSVLPVQFAIDGITAGNDTFRVHFPPDHTASSAFAVTVGTHVLAARTFGPFVYVWRDTVVTASPGNLATDTLSFYCS
ncbi:MAG TPA: hypothetical protein VGM77_02930 [Gemmatimonadales bacterium]